MMVLIEEEDIIDRRFVDESCDWRRLEKLPNIYDLRSISIFFLNRFSIKSIKKNHFFGIAILLHMF